MDSLDGVKGMAFINAKNICLFLGVIFGSLGSLDGIFIIPSSILLILGGVQYFEYSKKRKKHLESLLENKFEKYEKDLLQIKEDLEKSKIEVTSLKNRLNISQMSSFK